MEYQISFFDNEIKLAPIDEELLKGSGFAGGKVRIYAAALQTSSKDFAEYLQNEYGTGGHSCNGGFFDYNSNGISLRWWKEDVKQYYSWSEIAKRIKRLIAIDVYLTDEEKNIAREIMKKHGTLPMPVPRFKYE